MSRSTHDRRSRSRPADEFRGISYPGLYDKTLNHLYKIQSDWSAILIRYVEGIGKSEFDNNSFFEGLRKLYLDDRVHGAVGVKCWRHSEGVTFKVTFKQTRGGSTKTDRYYADLTQALR